MLHECYKRECSGKCIEIGFLRVFIKNVKKCNKIYVIILQRNNSYVTLMLQTLRYQIQCNDNIKTMKKHFLEITYRKLIQREDK